MNVVVLLFACALLGICTAIASECHSCMSYCKTLPSGKLDPESCDCVGNETCSGDYCFAKVETFPEEYTAIIQKGCVKNLPNGVDGCQYAGQAESVHCYCAGNKCNTKNNFDFYTPKPLPTVECCECSEPRGEKCPKDTCLRKCRGNYCLVDFEGVEQGCGLGLPRLQNFLRVYNFSDMTGDTTCARYQATSSTIVHGCVCTKPTGMCNEVNKSREYQLEKVVKRRLDDQNYCYSLHQKSKRTFDKDVFKKSDTCEGHYCFVSMTTTELVVESSSSAKGISGNEAKTYVGVSRPRFEILAGCLKVDDDEKVSLGCTTEYSRNQSEPISRHCICDSHLCNYYHLLTANEQEKGQQGALNSVPGDSERSSSPSTVVQASPDSSSSTVSRQTLFTPLMLSISFIIYRDFL